jgi:hypothetical protein
MIQENNMEIMEFAEMHSLKMEVRRRKAGDYYASFSHAETKRDCFLEGTYGNGKNKKEAIKQYAKEISGKLLVVDAYKETRREIPVPALN